MDEEKRNLVTEVKEAIIDELNKKNQEDHVAMLQKEIQILKEENRKIGDKLMEKSSPSKTFEEALTSMMEAR